MSGLLFVSQAILESLAEQGKIEFAGQLMTLREGDGKGRSYTLEPAVRFLQVVGAETDPHGLVAKVKTLAQVRDLHGEALGDSVLIGDIAYEVQPGFLAEASALEAAAAPGSPKEARPRAIRSASPPSPARLGVAPARSEPPTSAHAPAPSSVGPGVTARSPARWVPGTPALPEDLEEKRKEAEALARFLLKNLP